MIIKFRNYSMRTEERHNQDFYDWCVLVDEPEKVLAKIAEVQYTLHPTFPDPFRVSTDREDRFALYGAGWGEFTIAIRVVFVDGSDLAAEHYLTLKERDWPGHEPKAEADFDSPEEQRVYLELREESSRWMRTKTLGEKVGLSLPDVQKVLGQLVGKGLARSASVPSLDDQKLWGATAVVGASPAISLDISSKLTGKGKL